MSVFDTRSIWAALLVFSAMTFSSSAADSSFRLAAGPAQQKADTAGKDSVDNDSVDNDSADKDEVELTIDEKFAKRFPQPARAGDLIGLPVLDFNDSTIGYVSDVARKPDGEIVLIVPYGAWFGWLNSDWGRRPVAIPVKAVAKLALQLNALEFSREDFDGAPTWARSEGISVGRDEKVMVALGRR